MDSRRGPDHSPFMHIYHKLLHVASHSSHGSTEETLRELGPGAPQALQGSWFRDALASPQQIGNCPQPQIPVPLPDPETYEAAPPGNPRISEKRDLEE